ncbi:MAG: RNA polymerase sigma factor [Myxococcota bacterium]
MHDDELHRALVALREAPDLAAPECGPRWRAVQQALQRFGRTVGGGVLHDREDAVAEAMVKVLRNIRQLRADDAPGGRSWLAQLYQHTYIDVIRRRQRRREVFDEPLPGEGERESLLDRQPAPEPGPDPAVLDSAELAPFVDALFDRVHDYLEAHARRNVRQNAFRRAQLAYESIVRGRPTEELLAEMGGQVRPATFYQWVRRGREEVLVPVLRQWVAEADVDADGPEHGFALQLLAILKDRERSDAGQPRPLRKKKKPPEGDD